MSERKGMWNLRGRFWNGRSFKKGFQGAREGKGGKANGSIFEWERKEAEGRGNKLKGGTEREKRGHLFLGNFEGNGRKVKGAGKRKGPLFYI